MVKVIKKAIKKEKKLNPLKIMAVVFIGLIVIAFIVSYISNRDSSFIDEEEVILVEPTAEVDGVDKCKEYCIGYDAQGYDWEGDNCRCWFRISGEGECKSQCNSKEADSYDWYEGRFKSDEDYCRCWFEMEGGPVGVEDELSETIWNMLILAIPIVFMGIFLRKIFRW